MPRQPSENKYEAKDHTLVTEPETGEEERWDGVFGTNVEKLRTTRDSLGW